MRTGSSLRLKEFMEDYLCMTEAVSHSGRNSQRFNTDTDIFRSEIHIIQLIGDYKKLHVSEIGRRLGVTKGAVSQIIKKLEKKGLVRKEIDPENHTRTLAELTEKGKTAWRGHEEFHLRHHREMLDFLEALDDQDLELIRSFMKKVLHMTREHL